VLSRRLSGNRGHFVRNVTTLMSGKVIAAAVAILTTPIVSRLFDPGDFGVAAQFISIVSILVTICALGYETAFVLPAERDEAISLLALAYRLLLVFSVAVLLLLGVGALLGVRIRSLDQLGYLQWLLPLGVLIVGAGSVQSSWLTRTKGFRASSVALVANNLTASGSRIGLGLLFGSSGLSLVAGHLAGAVVLLLVQANFNRPDVRAALARGDRAALGATARAYAEFPKLNAPASMVFATGRQLPVLMLGHMYSTSVAGFYAMAFRLVYGPVDVLASSVRRVFLQRAAEITKRGGSLRRSFMLSIGSLAAIGILPTIGMWLFGEPLSRWFLGARWTYAGRYLEIIAPALFMLLVTAPCNGVFIVLRKQQRWLAQQVTLTALRLVAFALAFALHATAEWAVRAFVIATVAGSLWTIYSSLRIIARADAAAAGAR
jgi:O-antigen/teichoic acid export membrane protein